MQDSSGNQDMDGGLPTAGAPPQQEGGVKWHEADALKFQCVKNALLISGGYDQRNNNKRYLNHLIFMYNTLKDSYNYEPSRMKVLYADGKCEYGNPPGIPPNPIPIDKSATRDNVLDILRGLAKSLTPLDQLFIYTTNHGAPNDNSTEINSAGPPPSPLPPPPNKQVILWLWHDKVLDDEFSALVNAIPAAAIYLTMVQCFSGGFIKDFQQKNRVITTSVRSDEVAYAMLDGEFSEFTFHWISAVAGKDPRGNVVTADTDGDGQVSLKEAFEYAKVQDKQNEHPQFNNTLEGPEDKAFL